jgi:hypothetical protein
MLLPSITMIAGLSSESCAMIRLRSTGRSNFSQRHHQLCSKLWYFMKRIAMRLTRLAAYLDLFPNYKG